MNDKVNNAKAFAPNDFQHAHHEEEIGVDMVMFFGHIIVFYTRGDRQTFSLPGIIVFGLKIIDQNS